MGQKVNPHGLRVGVIKNWDSRWFAKDQDFGDTLVEDFKLRKTLKQQLYAAGVPKIEIERDAACVFTSTVQSPAWLSAAAAQKSKSFACSAKRCSASRFPSILLK